MQHPHAFAAAAAGAAALLLLSSTACAQTFEAGAATGVFVDEGILVDPGAVNVAAEEAFAIEELNGTLRAAVESDELEQQQLITVGPMIRTCPCTRVGPGDVVCCSLHLLRGLDTTLLTIPQPPL